MNLFKVDGTLKARAKLLFDLQEEQGNSELTETDLDAYLAQSSEYKKYKRDNLTVTTSSGKTFDADIKSRLNMSDAVLLSTETAIASTMWKLADNSVVEVTVAELKEARLLALQAFGSLTL